LVASTPPEKCKLGEAKGGKFVEDRRIYVGGKKKKKRGCKKGRGHGEHALGTNKNMDLRRNMRIQNEPYWSNKRGHAGGKIFSIDVCVERRKRNQHKTR